MTAISHHPKPVNNLPRRSPTENWQRGTIFAATFYRIHDTPKPVKNLPFQSPAKPPGREEPFFQPPVAASTTIREASPAHNMQSLPPQPTTKRNHYFSPVNHLPPYGAEMRPRNHFFRHQLQNPLPSQASSKASK